MDRRRQAVVEQPFRELVEVLPFVRGGVDDVPEFGVREISARISNAGDSTCNDVHGTPEYKLPVETRLPQSVG